MNNYIHVYTIHAVSSLECNFSVHMKPKRKLDRRVRNDRYNNYNNWDAVKRYAGAGGKTFAEQNRYDLRESLLVGTLLGPLSQLGHHGCDTCMPPRGISKIHRIHVTKHY